ncbi:MAG: hypothetical protein RBS92_04715 [Candidatus Cloacimonadales bacterium]|jgi:hypothetical protein|nr:hypothetical protein [Candidatus Cloacimonadales bacterium]
MEELINIIQEKNTRDKLTRVKNEFLSFYASMPENSGSAILKELAYKLYALYDEHFFFGFFSKNISVSIMLSNRMTKTAGKVKHRKKTSNFEITFSIPLLYDIFQINKGQTYYVNGLPCINTNQALMRVMEHELVHIIETLYLGHTSCNKAHFKHLANHLFGHTKTKHEIEFNPSVQTEYSFKLGDKVQFSFQEKTHKGFINRITKRATVLVENPRGSFQNKQGKRFLKYYVPLHVLQKIS